MLRFDWPHGPFFESVSIPPACNGEHAHTWQLGCLLTRVLLPYTRSCSLAYCELTRKTGRMWLTCDEVYLCWGWDVSVVGEAMV